MQNELDKSVLLKVLNVAGVRTLLLFAKIQSLDEPFQLHWWARPTDFDPNKDISEIQICKNFVKSKIVLIFEKPV